MFNNRNSLLFVCLTLSGLVFFLFFKLGQLEKTVIAEVLSHGSLSADIRTIEDRVRELIPEQGEAGSRLSARYGPVDARIRLLLFADTECSYCKKQHKIVKRVVDRYPDKISWEYRHFIASQHNPAASRQSAMLGCVYIHYGNSAFWAVLDDIFLLTSAAGRGVRDIGGLLALNDIDSTGLMSDCDQNRLRKMALRDSRESVRYSVERTPTTVLLDDKGKRYAILAGYHSEVEIIEKITEMLQ